MNNVTNSVAYLRTSREFPKDVEGLSEEVDKAYIDTANNVNARTIGIFTVKRPAQNGESWYLLKNQRQQGFRQVYTFTTLASIPHGINLNLIDGFTRLWGTYTDGTNWYGIIAANTTGIAGQLTFYVDPNNIVFVGAPAITRGRI